ncbi:hypothetical protein [Paenibacillus aceti]|uniref:Uncharacterized protein n=1 Tax=Paenibacillus aceti TaxID=1820010 RepID=A0ABQ1VXJ5_9BACL|nr:hypothetical protein [Paenibacillus aceti]GGG02560.1 hypothetical protein GCM10010913_25360 [Paenibacillus aceti]
MRILMVIVICLCLALTGCIRENKGAKEQPESVPPTKQQDQTIPPEEPQNDSDEVVIDDEPVIEKVKAEI